VQLKDPLIKLGNTHPELRDHLRHILSSLDEGRDIAVKAYNEMYSFFYPEWSQLEGNNRGIIQWRQQDLERVGAPARELMSFYEELRFLIKEVSKSESAYDQHDFDLADISKNMKVFRDAKRKVDKFYDQKKKQALSLIREAGGTLEIRDLIINRYPGLRDIKKALEMLTHEGKVKKRGSTTKQQTLTYSL